MSSRIDDTLEAYETIAEVSVDDCIPEHTSSQRRRYHTGTYIVTARSVIITSGLSLASKQIGFVGIDEYIEVVQIRYLIKDKRVRAKLSSGGYVSLFDTENSFAGAEPLQLGTYVTVSKSAVFNMSEACRPMKTLDVGAYINIVETKFSQKERRLRGKLSDGGWLTLEDKKEGRLRAVPLPLGTYQTHPHLLCIHRRASMDSGGGLMLDGESFVDVVETKFVKDNSEVRGRLAQGGWVSLLDTLSNYQFARPVPKGVYFTSKETLAVCAGVSCQSNIVKLLKPFTPIEVVETRYLATEKQVRGRLAESGGWVSLTEGKGQRLARPMRAGNYLTLVEPLVVRENVRLDSKQIRALKSGKLVSVVEIKYVKEGGWIRGRLSSGGWITLVNAKDKKNYAKPFERRSSV